MNHRQEKILELLAPSENVTVTDLSKALSVTEVTIRTDLQYLSSIGKVRRFHGSAQLLEEKTRQELSYQTRINQNIDNKIKIGKYAAQLINSFDSVLLDSSTTVLKMAEAIRERSDLKETTIIPTGIWTAIELMSSQSINVLIPSGYIRSISGSIAGLPTSSFFKEINIDKAYLGAFGISLEQGITDTHLLEIELKKEIISKAKEVIVLADGSKFTKRGLATFSDIKNITQIITDSSAPKNIVKKIQNSGTDVKIIN